MYADAQKPLEQKKVTADEVTACGSGTLSVPVDTTGEDISVAASDTTDAGSSIQSTTRKSRILVTRTTSRAATTTTTTTKSISFRCNQVGW